VEGTQRRAIITAERCRDLNNVRVYCDNLAEFTSDEKFDVVTLIGVLEYSRLFINAKDPVQKCLQIAKSFLAEKGILVIAIENQLGLKYFNGCTEDHTGIPYFGINDLYADATPVTFGKHEIETKLALAGFDQVNFFFPFPDYKLPTAILSEAALENTQLNVPDLLIQHSGKDYMGTLNRAFSEPLAWRALHRNRLLSHMANSFLIYAGKKNSNTSTDKTWLAKLYSRSNRQLQYQIETTIGTDESGNIEITKRNLYPESASREKKFLDQITIEKSDYIHGSLYVNHIQQAMTLELGLNEVLEAYSGWIKFLQEESIQIEGQKFLPGDYVDCIPSNVIQKSDGSLEYFDAEWVSQNPIPLSWVVVRGIVYS
ncbi:MAG TPA: hypothetical protein VEA37_07800, partial [Flavobacterium sp.]|nr:hypothetical protein [Flavobacterium sp.]